MGQANVKETNERDGNEMDSGTEKIEKKRE
jgi:hypothetical protein